MALNLIGGTAHANEQENKDALNGVQHVYARGAS